MPKEDLHQRPAHAKVEEGDDEVAHRSELAHHRMVALPDVNQRSETEPGDYCHGSDDEGQRLVSNPEHVGQVPVGHRDHLVRIPEMPGPIEVPTRTAEKDADDDEPHPQAEEAEQEGAYRHRPFL